MAKTKMKKKTKIILAVVAVVVLLLAILVIKIASAVKTSVSELNTYMYGVQAQTLEEHDLSTAISATGKVESQNVVSVTSDLNCKIKELPVALGDYVEEGDVLCVFDDSDVRDQISQLESQLSTSEKLAAKQTEILQRSLKDAKDSQTKEVAQAAQDVADAQKAYDDATTAYNNAKSALDTAKAAEVPDELAIQNAQAVADAAYEQQQAAKSALDTAKRTQSSVETSCASAVQSAQDSLDTNSISGSGNADLTKQLSQLYRKLDEMTIVAEQSGIITVLNVSQGDIPNGALMQIADDKNLKVTVSIKEKDILKLAEGMKATVKADAIGEEEYKATVSKVINFATSSGNEMSGESSKGYSAEIVVDGDSDLLLGMTAKVDIIVTEAKTALSVAYDSIATDEDGTTYVYRAVEQEDGLYLIERVDVTVGQEGDYYTEISSDELNEGDLIVSYPEEVEEGSEVTIITDEDDIFSVDVME
ncbi:MAG: efflux RND transporter periplasmic adaptor subunit [Lachnospiraceae bacterium]|nr:efflux RND transporter periplasmic adaptor subunit [Lachnospiraceae bacterium]